MRKQIALVLGALTLAALVGGLYCIGKSIGTSGSLLEPANGITEHLGYGITPSPACNVLDNSTDGGSYQPARPNGINVSPGDSVTVELASTSGVRSWSLSVFGLDDQTNASPPSLTFAAGPPNSYSFTFPNATGRAVLLQSVVNGGVDVNGTHQPSYTTTIGIFSLTPQGLRTLALGETFESCPVGWVCDVNSIIRGGSGGGTTTAAGTPVTPPLPLADYQVIFQNPYDAGTAIDSGVLGSLSLTQYGNAIQWRSLWATTGDAFALTQNGLDGGPSALASTTAWSVRYEFSFAPAVDGQYPETDVCACTGITTGSTCYCTFFAGSSAANVMGYAEWTLPGSRGSPTTLPSGWNTYLATSNGHQRLGLLCDGAVLHFQVSADGITWPDTFSIAAPESFSYYGFAVTSGTGATGFSTGFVYSNTLGWPAQYQVTAATNASPSVLSVTPAPSFPLGTQVAIHGLLGNTGPNTSYGNYTFGGNTLVVGETSSTLTTLLNGNGAYTDGGVVTVTGL